MRALAWQGRRDVRVETVPDPEIREPTDAIVRITSTAICGSDLHLYEVLGPYLKPGDILGHEPMGIVEEIGAEVGGSPPRPRRCGRCWPTGWSFATWVVGACRIRSVDPGWPSAGTGIEHSVGAWPA